jgi:virginiamycin B lyase
MLAGCAGGSHTLVPDAGRNPSVATNGLTPTQQTSLSSPLGTSGITEYPIPAAANVFLNDIAAGRDGNLWFIQSDNKIGRITTSGTVAEYAIPTENKNLPDVASVTAGPDKNMWFTEAYSNKIGKITETGTITRFPVPTSDSVPAGIASGPDGNLWFTEGSAGKIGKITPAGTIIEYPLSPNYSEPVDIVAGPDGNLWFTTIYGVGKITTGGKIITYPLPTTGAIPENIVKGPDGKLWFIERVTVCVPGHSHCVNVHSFKIGKITIAGSITEYPLASTTIAASFTVGSDGNLWFLDNASRQIGKITITGKISEYPLPADNELAETIVAGPDGNLWLTESAENATIVNKIAKINPARP